jgi:hypothetical protein
MNTTTDTVLALLETGETFTPTQLMRRAECSHDDVWTALRELAKAGKARRVPGGLADFGPWELVKA